MSAISPAINPYYLPGRLAERSGHAPIPPTLMQSQAQGSQVADDRLARPVTSAGTLVQPASHTAGFHLTTSL